MHIPASLRQRIPHQISEHVQSSVTASNVGREDRLVRGCIALSLILLGGFTFVGSRNLNLITVTFLILGGYFALTAALGSDPGYHRAGIDTRSDAEAFSEGEGPGDDFDVLDLTDGPDEPTATDSPDEATAEDTIEAAHSVLPALHR